MSSDYLANLIIKYFNGRDLTPLKLQKLCFYVYGLASAYEVNEQLGKINFEAWEHGPVIKELYKKYKDFGSDPIVTSSTQTSCPIRLENVIKATLQIYGRLSPWQIREESHLEEPWIKAYKYGSGTSISDEKIRTFFFKKFRTGHVLPPTLLSGTDSFILDSIPVTTYKDIFDLAKQLSIFDI